MIEEECPILVVDKHPDSGAGLVQGIVKTKWAEGYDLVSISRNYIVFRRREVETKKLPSKKPPKSKGD